MGDSVDSLRQAISALDFSCVEQRLEAARLRVRLGIALNDEGEHVGALCSLRRALAVVSPGYATARELGIAYTSLVLATWFTKGPSAAQSAAELAVHHLKRARGPGVSEALVRAQDNLALCYFETGAYEKARAVYLDLIKYAERVHDPADETCRRLNRRIAITFLEDANADAGGAFLEKARPPDDAGSREWVEWLNASALVFESTWRLDKAVSAYRQIVALFEAADGCALWPVSASLTNAALLFSDLGQERDLARVQELIEMRPGKDLPLSVRLGARRLAACLALERGDFGAADRLWEEMTGLAEAEAGADSNKLKEIISDRARARIDNAQPEKAERIIRDWLAREAPIDAVGLTLSKLGPSLVLAETMLRQGQRVEAREQLSGLFVSALASSERRDLYDALTLFADCERGCGKRARAILFGKLGARFLADDGRSVLEGSHVEGFRLHRLVAPLDRLIDDLVEEGRYLEADQIQSIRSLEVFKVIARGLRMDAHQPGTILLREDERTYSDELYGVHKALNNTRLQALTGRGAVRENAVSRFRALSERVKELLDTALSTPWASEPEVSHDGSVIATGAVDLQALSASETAEVRFIVGEQRPAVTVVGAGRQVFREIDASVSDLRRSVYEFWRACGREASDCIEQAQSLYDILIRPIESELASISRLHLVAPGVMSHIPFAALHDGHRYSVERWTIVHRPISDISPRNTAHGKLGSVFAFGNTKATDRLPALHYLAEEFAGLTEAFKQTLVRCDEEFTAAALVEALCGGPDLVHIASHFEPNPGSLHRSRLLMSSNALTAGELLSERFAWNGVRLLVLSACSTAVRDAVEHRMEELPALFLARGVKSVVSALWPISDQSTAMLMKAFYSALAGTSAGDPAEALAEAQRVMIGEGGCSSHLDRTRGFGLPGPDGVLAHPYGWAGFKCHARG